MLLSISSTHSKRNIVCLWRPIIDNFFLIGVEKSLKHMFEAAEYSFSVTNWNVVTQFYIRLHLIDVLIFKRSLQTRETIFPILLFDIWVETVFSGLLFDFWFYLHDFYFTKLWHVPHQSYQSKFRILPPKLIWRSLGLQEAEGEELKSPTSGISLFSLMSEFYEACNWKILTMA